MVSVILADTEDVWIQLFRATGKVYREPKLVMFRGQVQSACGFQIEEALRAASAIGDDRLQKQARGYVVPESFTHGSSKQRVKWFYRGLKTGDMNQGDTFSVPYDQL